LLRDGRYEVKYASTLLGYFVSILKYYCIPSGVIPKTYREIIDLYFEDFVHAYHLCDGARRNRYVIFTTREALVQLFRELALKRGWRVDASLYASAGQVEEIDGRKFVSKRDLYKVSLKPSPLAELP
jgi:hypothetical protein